MVGGGNGTPSPFFLYNLFTLFSVNFYNPGTFTRSGDIMEDKSKDPDYMYIEAEISKSEFEMLSKMINTSDPEEILRELFDYYIAHGGE